MSQRRIPYRIKSDHSWAAAWRTPLIPAAPRLRALLLVTCVLALSLMSLWLRRAELEANALMPVTPALPYEQASVLAPRAEAVDVDKVQLPRPFTVRRGQVPSMLLQELGVEPETVFEATTVLANYVDLRRLRAGETGLAYYDQGGRLSRVRLRLAQKGWVDLERTVHRERTAVPEESVIWTSTWRDFVRTSEPRQVGGTLDSFLVADVEEAGAPPQLAWSMSEVLRWDLDFNRDLREGDTFRVLYEEERLDGHFHQVGRVLALSYVNRGVEHEAYLWSESADGDGDEDAYGYYDADGRPLQKMFLRSPLPFTRVTSRFSNRRFHPVLKTYRPHHGVDFGAPRGTPARVTASGTVSFAGRSGGAGKMVRVRHTNGYETSYLHLSGYGPGVRSGKRLRQGDVVGYVGSTGLATAPHLDYRVKRNGRYMDPMKLENRPAEPIPQSRLAAFQQRRDELLKALSGEIPLERAESRLAEARSVPGDVPGTELDGTPIEDGDHPGRGSATGAR